MRSLTAGEGRIVEWLGARQAAMIELLGELVNIDSGTAHVAGVNAMAHRLSAFLSGAGLESRILTAAGRGNGVRSIVKAAWQARPALLMGHLDTVFALDEPRRRPFAFGADRAFGPGVADMKSGLVLLSFVMAAFQACGGNPVPLVGLFTGDEEVGSSVYRPIIEAEAAQADYAFNAEPARVSGNVVKERRGGVFMRLSVAGKAAHAGLDFKAGISAIEEIAHKTVALHALNHGDHTGTVNVGVISGGQSVNTTAPNAEALIDLRFSYPEERDVLMASIENIVATNWVTGTAATLEITGEFVPLVPTPAAQALFEKYRTAAADLGFAVDAEATGGCADSGFAAQAGAATLCGVGPVGGKAHSLDEYVEIETLVPRAQALALTIARLGRSTQT